MTINHRDDVPSPGKLPCFDLGIRTIDLPEPPGGGQVQERPSWGGDRQATAVVDLDRVEPTHAMDADPRLATRVSAANGHVHTGAGRFREQRPHAGRRSMAQKAAGSAGEDRRHLASVRRWGRMSQQVDPAMQPLQASGSKAEVDGVISQLSGEELGASDDAVLARREASAATFASDGAVDRTTRLLVRWPDVVFAAYMTVKSSRLFRATFVSPCRVNPSRASPARLGGWRGTS
jgi:hypothetical protein